MIVYRFERNGIGPYVGRSTGVIVGSFRRSDPKTKSEKKYVKYFEEALIGVQHEDRMRQWMRVHSDKSWIYGCKSKKHLRGYFGTNFKGLFKQGYRIKRYRVPDEQVIDLGVEVAFPVRYHKAQSPTGIRKLVEKESW